MQIQEIAEAIINQVKSALIDVFGKPVEGFGLCIKNPDNCVVLVNKQANGEQTYIGIQDNQGTYFYIRYAGVAAARKLAANEVIGACDGNFITVPLKIVLISPFCHDVQAMLLSLQRALFTSNLAGPWSYGQKQVRLHEKTFTFLPWDIFEAETGKEKTEFRASNLSMAAIEFDLKFKTNYNHCTEIKLC